MPLVQLRLRRRTFLLISAALACGGEQGDKATLGDAGDAPDPEDTTGVAPTTGPIGPISATDTATSPGAETGIACAPSGTDTGLTVADFEVGACMSAPGLADVYVLRDDRGFYA